MEACLFFVRRLLGIFVLRFLIFRYNMDLHPLFLERIRNDFGGEADKFISAIGSNAVVSVRTNPRKLTDVCLPDRVPWCSSGFYLSQRPVFTLDPLFNAGAYYVQEASSMFLEQAVRQYAELTPDTVILDLCASPGGKSTHLLSLLDGRGLLVSNEYVGQRVAPLRENITKWGFPNVVVTNAAPADLGKCDGLFDVILVDAPCSGEGMFRKDDQAVKEWSPENVAMCAKRQREILNDVFPALKEGGLLIYSTCTYNCLEDEDNVRWICAELGGEYLHVNVDGGWHIADSGYGYHFYPHLSRGEGFFLAAIRKTSSANSVKCKVQKFKAPVNANVVKKWLVDGGLFSFYETADKTLIAFPNKFSDVLALLKSHLKVVQAGVAVAQVKGSDFLPSPSLALSLALNRSEFNTINVDWQQAVSFLKRENLVLPDAPKGWLLVVFNNVALGWLKNMGNRSNGYFPVEWHVRMNADVNLYTPLF